MFYARKTHVKITQQWKSILTKGEKINFLSLVRRESQETRNWILASHLAPAPAHRLPPPARRLLSAACRLPNLRLAASLRKLREASIWL